jgi:hypothetical protein
MHMSKDDLVVVRTYLNAVEAEVAQGALEAAGLECMLRADDCGGLRPALWMGRGVQLIVRAEDVDRAEQVLGPADQRG